MPKISETITVDVADYYSRFKNKKRVASKLAKEIKQFLRSFGKVILNFPDTFCESFETDEMVASLIHNLSKYIWYEDFKERLVLEYDTGKININPYASKVFRKRFETSRNAVIKWVSIAAAIFMFILALNKLTIGTQIYNGFVEKIFPYVRIEHKISYLIDKYKLSDKNINKERAAKAIEAQCKKYNTLSENLVLAVIKKESEFDRLAKGPCIARSGQCCKGLMQIYVLYWGRLLPDDNLEAIWDEKVNIEIGCNALDEFIKEAKGNLKKGLIIYNGGYNYIYRNDNDKMEVAINYESDAYVADIMGIMNDLSMAFK